jgi:glycosyltransferase involved in cell wall biosynthesis
MISNILMDMNLCPIAIFTYNRPDTLRETVNSLLNAAFSDQSILFIFSDGPKRPTEGHIVDEIRKYIRQIKGFKEVHYYFSETNHGLAKSIISGVSKVLQIYKSVIVLEDDLIVTPNFLSFMNKALNEYHSDDKVFSISGYSFDLKKSQDEINDAYFLNRGWSWGWATWKNRWDKVDWSVSDYNEFSRNPSLKKEFNKGGSDLTAMLHKQMTNKLDSWAIRWFYAQFKDGGLTLYPVSSKILNNGFDNRATHTTGSNKRYIPLLDATFKDEFTFPKKVEINAHFQKSFQRKMGIGSRLKSRIGSVLINILRTTKNK